MHVPENIRLVLSAESAANDGLAYPFLSISIYLSVEASRRVAIGKWFLIGWLCTSLAPGNLLCPKSYYISPYLTSDQVILGTLIGSCLGNFNIYIERFYAGTNLTVFIYRNCIL